MTDKTKYPKIKPVFPWYKVGSTIVIQGKNGLSHEIVDEFGHAEHLLTLLDGKSTVEEITHAFTQRFPDVTSEDVLLAISSFDEMRLLEDAAAPVLDSYKMERYSRNLGFLEMYGSLSENKHDFQERLCNAHVVLLGVGGVGSHVSLSLVGLGVSKIIIVDYDDIELSNLNRQILYKEADIGKSKLEMAAQRIKEFGNNTEVIPIKLKLSSPQDVERVVRGADLVIAAVDRPKMTILPWINEGCIAAGVPFIAGGVDRDRAFHFTVKPGETGCVECWERHLHRNDPHFTEIRRQMIEFEATGERFGEDRAAIYPLVAVQAASLTAELLRLISGIAPPIALGKVIEIPFDDFVAKEAESWPRDPECPTCGHLTAAHKREEKIHSRN